MTFKDLTIEELKNYKDRSGFVFSGVAPSHRDGCLKVSNALIRHNYTNTHPEFIVELNPNRYAFVYPEACYFRSIEFIRKSIVISCLTGQFAITPLASFLYEN